MYVERSQPIVRSCRALKRGFSVEKRHLKCLRPPATACDRLRPLAPPLEADNLAFNPVTCFSKLKTHERTSLSLDYIFFTMLQLFSHL